MKKVIIAIICLIIVLAIPVIGLPVYAKAIPDVYGDTYLAAMADKHDRLHSIDGEKIILVGGSSMAFGVDSRAIERETGMSVVNMGLYAALGSKTTLDLTESGIKKGDIVIFAPEMDRQAYSLYTDAQITLQTLEAKKSMIRDIPVKEWAGLFNALPQYVEESKKLSASGVPHPTNAYSRSAFNEYGDNVYQRPYNIMPDLYLTSNTIEIDNSLIDEAFIDYLNDYIKRVRKKGAQFYFTFPPMNRLALTQDSYENRIAVYNALVEKLDCEIIGNIEDHIMDEGYFYDSNYHLNDSGVTYNTKVLVGDIKRQLKDTSQINIEVLPPAGVEDSHSSGSNDETYSEDFEYIQESAGWAITGVKESAKSKDTLILPQHYEGRAVYKIKEGAFAGCAVKTLNIGENITVLEDGAFKGCDSLKSVNLAVKLGVDDSLPSVGDNLMAGANADIKLYVPASKYGVMVIDYFWMRYAQYLSVAQ